VDDLDLPNRRTTIAGHTQRLGDLAHRALRAWLDQRRTAWPHTPNRHVLIAEQRAARGADRWTGPTAPGPGLQPVDTTASRYAATRSTCSTANSNNPTSWMGL